MPDAAGAPTQTPSKFAVFLRRLLSTVILWTIVIVALFCGNRLISNYVFLFVVVGLATIGLIEFYGLVEKRGLVCFKFLGVGACLIFLIGTYLNLTSPLGMGISLELDFDFETCFLILMVLGLCIWQLFSPANAAGITAISTTLFGFMYVPWLFNFIQKIYFIPGPEGVGNYFVLYFVIVTKFSDTGAYSVGSLIGKHKMIPRISPGKTWEGFVGAIVVSTGASLLFTHFLSGHMPGITAVHAIVLGVVLSVTAVIGDLVESLFKREAGMKDSGGLFPGIGGILDLLDSLLFNAPIMYLYMRHVLKIA